MCLQDSTCGKLLLYFNEAWEIMPALCYFNPLKTPNTDVHLKKIQTMKTTFVLLLSCLLTACNSTNTNQEEEAELKWATRMADAVMHASDSLIYYQRDNPKYEYDFAFLASAIDQLGEQDEKYANYAR